MFLRVLAFIANSEVRDAYSVRYIRRGDSQLTTCWVADPEVRSCWRHYLLISAFSWIRISMYFTRHLDTFILNWHFGKNNVYFGRIGRLVPPGGDSMGMYVSPLPLLSKNITLNVKYEPKLTARPADHVQSVTYSASNMLWRSHATIVRRVANQLGPYQKSASH